MLAVLLAAAFCVVGWSWLRSRGRMVLVADFKPGLAPNPQPTCLAPHAASMASLDRASLSHGDAMAATTEVATTAPAAARTEDAARASPSSEAGSASPATSHTNGEPATRLLARSQTTTLFGYALSTCSDSSGLPSKASGPVSQASSSSSLAHAASAPAGGLEHLVSCRARQLAARNTSQTWQAAALDAVLTDATAAVAGAAAAGAAAPATATASTYKLPPSWNISGLQAPSAAMDALASMLRGEGLLLPSNDRPNGGWSMDGLVDAVISSAPPAPSPRPPIRYRSGLQRVYGSGKAPLQLPVNAQLPQHLTNAYSRALLAAGRDVYADSACLTDSMAVPGCVQVLSALTVMPSATGGSDATGDLTRLQTAASTALAADLAQLTAPSGAAPGTTLDVSLLSSTSATQTTTSRVASGTVVHTSPTGTAAHIIWAPLALPQNSPAALTLWQVMLPGVLKDTSAAPAPVRVLLFHQGQPVVDQQCSFPPATGGCPPMASLESPAAGALVTTSVGVPLDLPGVGVALEAGRTSTLQVFVLSTAPSAQLLAAGHVLLGPEAVTQEIGSLWHPVGDAAAAQQHEPANSTVTVAVETWGKQLQPMVADICFLVDTAPQLAALLRTGLAGAHGTAAGPGWPDTVAQEIAAWCCTALNILEVCVDHQLAATARLVLDTMHHAGLQLSCADDKVVAHAAAWLLSEVNSVVGLPPVAVTTGARVSTDSVALRSAARMAGTLLSGAVSAATQLRQWVGIATPAAASAAQGVLHDIRDQLPWAMPAAAVAGVAIMGVFHLVTDRTGPLPLAAIALSFPIHHVHFSVWPLALLAAIPGAAYLWSTARQRWPHATTAQLCTLLLLRAVRGLAAALQAACSQISAAMARLETQALQPAQPSPRGARSSTTTGPAALSVTTAAVSDRLAEHMAVRRTRPVSAATAPSMPTHGTLQHAPWTHGQSTQDWLSAHLADSMCRRWHHAQLYRAAQAAAVTFQWSQPPGMRSAGRRGLLLSGRSRESFHALSSGSLVDTSTSEDVTAVVRQQTARSCGDGKPPGTPSSGSRTMQRSASFSVATMEQWKSFCDALTPDGTCAVNLGSGTLLQLPQGAEVCSTAPMVGGLTRTVSSPPQSPAPLLSLSPPTSPGVLAPSRLATPAAATLHGLAPVLLLASGTRDLPAGYMEVCAAVLLQPDAAAVATQGAGMSVRALEAAIPDMNACTGRNMATSLSASGVALCLADVRTCQLQAPHLLDPVTARAAVDVCMSGMETGDLVRLPGSAAAPAALVVHGKGHSSSRVHSPQSHFSLFSRTSPSSNRGSGDSTLSRAHSYSPSSVALAEGAHTVAMLDSQTTEAMSPHIHSTDRELALDNTATEGAQAFVPSIDVPADQLPKMHLTSHPRHSGVTSSGHMLPWEEEAATDAGVVVHSRDLVTSPSTAGSSPQQAMGPLGPSGEPPAPVPPAGLVGWPAAVGADRSGLLSGPSMRRRSSLPALMDPPSPTRRPPAGDAGDVVLLATGTACGSGRSSAPAAPDITASRGTSRQSVASSDPASVLHLPTDMPLTAADLQSPLSSSMQLYQHSGVLSPDPALPAMLPALGPSLLQPPPPASPSPTALQANSMFSHLPPPSPMRSPGLPPNSPARFPPGGGDFMLSTGGQCSSSGAGNPAVYLQVGGAGEALHRPLSQFLPPASPASRSPWAGAVSCPVPASPGQYRIQHGNGPCPLSPLPPAATHQEVVAATAAVAAAGVPVMPPSPGRIRLLPPPSPLLREELRASQQLYDASNPALLAPLSPFRQSFGDLQDIMGQPGAVPLPGFPAAAPLAAAALLTAPYGMSEELPRVRMHVHSAEPQLPHVPAILTAPPRSPSAPAAQLEEDHALMREWTLGLGGLPSPTARTGSDAETAAALPAQPPAVGSTPVLTATTSASSITAAPSVLTQQRTTASLDSSGVGQGTSSTSSQKSLPSPFSQVATGANTPPSPDMSFLEQQFLGSPPASCGNMGSRRSGGGFLLGRERPHDVIMSSFADELVESIHDGVPAMPGSSSSMLQSLQRQQQASQGGLMLPPAPVAPGCSPWSPATPADSLVPAYAMWDTPPAGAPTQDPPQVQLERLRPERHTEGVLSRLSDMLCKSPTSSDVDSAAQGIAFLDLGHAASTPPRDTGMTSNSKFAALLLQPEGVDQSRACSAPADMLALPLRRPGWLRGSKQADGSGMIVGSLDSAHSTPRQQQVVAAGSDFTSVYPPGGHWVLAHREGEAPLRAPADGSPTTHHSAMLVTAQPYRTHDASDWGSGGDGDNKQQLGARRALPLAMHGNTTGSDSSHPDEGASPVAAGGLDLEQVASLDAMQPDVDDMLGDTELSSWRGVRGPLLQLTGQYQCVLCRFAVHEQSLGTLTALLGSGAVSGGASVHGAGAGLAGGAVVRGTVAPSAVVTDPTGVCVRWQLPPAPAP